MKLWVDDLRTPPDNKWTWLKTSEQAIVFLAVVSAFNNTHSAYGWDIELMSLDHDLGGNDTTRPIVLWMIENDFWPEEIVIHTANPVGREWLEGMIERYKP